MHLHSLIPLSLALLSATTVAKPLSRRLTIVHQYDNSSVPAITQTSTDDNTPTATNASPTCTTTYKPTEAQDCYDVALQYNVTLSEPEASYDVYESKCRDVLSGYGVCIAALSITTSMPSVTAGPSSNATVSNATISNATISSNPTANQTLSLAGAMTLTALHSQTLTFTEGIGSTSRERTVVVTHTTIDVMTETVDMTASTLPSSGTESSDVATTDADSTTVNSGGAESFSATLTTSSGGGAGSATAMASQSAASCADSVPAPAITQAGVVSGCTKWYVAKPGDFCQSVANKYDLSVNTFMGWNPAVNAPICDQMLAGSAYCVESCGTASNNSPSTDETGSSSSFSVRIVVTSSTIVTTSTTVIADASPSTVNTASTGSNLAGASTSSTSSAPTSSSTVEYVSYTGDGSVAAGWPSMNDWIDYDTMFSNNKPAMKASCAQWGVPNDSDDEISEMNMAIQTIANSSGIDERFVLAIVMQESTGCVRVITTQYSVFNPGLMQSHNGTGSCNRNNVALDIATEGPYVSNAEVQTPCPDSEITQMIKDGTEGTSSGDGLQQVMATQKSAGYSGVQAYYRTARGYNGGSVAASGNLSDGCCTKSYASDVANRLRGWINGPHTFTG